MSTRKEMKLQVKRSVRQMRDVLTAMEEFADADDDGMLMTAFTFTQQLMQELHTGAISPNAIQTFLNEEHSKINKH